MLKIDNREEIQQYLLAETESPEATEYILEVLEKEEYLSQIYDEYNKVSNNNTFFECPIPHSIEDVEMFYTLHENLFVDQDGKARFRDKIQVVTYTLKTELVEQIAATITEGEFKLNQENKARIIDLLTKAIKKIRIKKQVKKRHKNRNKK